MTVTPDSATAKTSCAAEAGASVTLAVVTYRRNAGLGALLPALLPQAHQAVRLGHPTSILVVDNDPDQGARTLVDSFAALTAPAEPSPTDHRLADPHADDSLARSSDQIPVFYVTEAEPGIAAARARALSACVTDLLVFIDDDELPTQRWLYELLGAWSATGVAAVAGPVHPVYSCDPPTWISAGPFHASPDFTDGCSLTHAATSNLLLDLNQIRDLGIHMPTLGTRGGEDVIFTARITRNGGEILWCSSAVVTETVPPQRLRRSWVLRRSMIDGNNDASRQLDPAAARSLTHRLGLTASGTIRVGVGAGRSAAGVLRRSPKHVGGGLHTLMRGAGMCLGAWDVVYDGYARPGSSHWRRAQP